MNRIEELGNIIDEFKILKRSLLELRKDNPRACVSIKGSFGHYDICCLPKSFNEIAGNWIEDRIKELNDKIEK